MIFSGLPLTHPPGFNTYKFITKMSNNINKTQAIEKKNQNIIGETRHYPAASKEWSNSIYAYNKNTVKSLPVKDKMANNLLTSYFNFVPLTKNNTKSRRMRNLIRRNSTKKLFVSKAEIKQTNNKVIITAYTADREKEFLLRKLYFFNKSFKTAGSTRYISALQNIFNGGETNNQLVTSTAKKNTTYLDSALPNATAKKLGKFSRLHIRNAQLSRKKITKRLKKYTIRKNLFRNRLAISIVKKKNFLKNLFFYCFLKWTLSIFQINIYIYQFKAKKLIVINKGDYFKILNADTAVRNNNAQRSLSAPFKKINVILLQLLVITLKKTLVNANVALSLEKLISFLFRYFKFKYFENFVQKYLKKEILALNYLYMLSLNNFKFDKFLPGLKHLISKIYNKKVELNLVNLKYIHLNSDIFSESIAIKLRKKKNSLLRVLRGSLKLVKIPSKFSIQNNSVKENNIHKTFSNFRPLDNYKALLEQGLSEPSMLNKIGSVKDVLHVVLKKMFPRGEQQNESFVLNSALDTRVPVKTGVTKAKKTSILNSIKYKWITGVRLEAKGRLTKRFTASRSLFKFRYKGNLKNVDYSGIGLLRKAPSTVMLRGQVKPNLQYTFVSSKKRIGAFGIKGWISSN